MNLCDLGEGFDNASIPLTPFVDDRKSFADIQVYNLTQMKSDFDKEKEKLKPYFDPHLIFKIEVNQSVSEEDYTKFLERAGVKVISPSPLGKGYWISLAEDETLDTIKNRLQQYGVIARYKAFDAIESFSTTSITSPGMAGCFTMPQHERSAPSGERARSSTRPNLASE
jgi:hypothetical protein